MQTASQSILKAAHTPHPRLLVKKKVVPIRTRSPHRAQEVSKTFHLRLVWRDLAYWQLYHFPSMAIEPIRPGYSSMQWAAGQEADAQLRAWQRGQTGFPLVDAGVFGWVDRRCCWGCLESWSQSQVCCTDAAGGSS